MDESISDSVKKVPPPPLLKLRTDIFKKGVEDFQGLAEEEKEEGEVDTTDEEEEMEEGEVLFLSWSIQEKRMKIAQLEEEITAEQLEIERINKLKQGTEIQQQRFCELCNVTVNSNITWQDHINGKKHRKIELRRERLFQC